MPSNLLRIQLLITRVSQGFSLGRHDVKSIQLERIENWIAVVLSSLCFMLSLLTASPANAQSVYTSVPASNSVIMLQGNAVSGSITIPPATPGGPAPMPRFMAVTPDAKFVYVIDSKGAAVNVIDTAANAITATIPVGTCPTEISFATDGSKAYLSEPCSNGMSILDIATQNVSSVQFSTASGSLQFGGGVAVAPDGSKVYIGTSVGLGVYDTHFGMSLGFMSL
jgi:YVTN family beta-propeller protein